MIKQQPSSQHSSAPTKVLETLERSLSGFYQHQNETLQVHQQYLDQQSEYARTVHQLMQQQIELVSQGAAIPAEVDQQMQMFHAHQSETLRVHEQYLNQQSEQTQSALNITNQQLSGSGQKLPAATTSAPTIQKSASVRAVSAPVPSTSVPTPIPTPVQAVPVSSVPTPVQFTPTPSPDAVTVPVVVPAAPLEVSSKEVIAAAMMDLVRK